MMIVSTVFFSIILLAIAVIVAAVLYVIVGGVIHGLGSLFARPPVSSSTDTSRAQPLGLGESRARPVTGSDLPPSELPTYSAEATWERVQGRPPSATSPTKSRRRPFWS
jgi:hypothetical protein